MLSRRRFLGYGAIGMAVAASGCRPGGAFSQSPGIPAPSFNPMIDQKRSLALKKQYFLGYPLNMNTPPDDFFTWRKELQSIGIGDFGFNNVGNPYEHSSIEFNTHDFELDIIKRFGSIYGFTPSDTWGFLSHSGTDSNMHGMYLGRTILKSVTRATPRCYFTREAHYSIQILSDLLGLESIFIKTKADAAMDLEDLKSKLYENKDYPALVVGSIGTTFKGGIDDVDKIQDELAVYNSYLHVDAALFGGYLPHIDHGAQLVKAKKPRTSIPRFDSIAVSCHKFFGFPNPAGLFVTTQQNFNIFHKAYSKVHNPEYIGHVPGTITCSRDATKPAEFHYFSTNQSLANQAEDAQLILKNTDFLMRQMDQHFEGMVAKRSSKLSNTIYFKRPSDRIVNKYSLATMHYVNEKGQQEDLAHVVVMPHASRKILEEFLNDLDMERNSVIG